MAGLGGKVWLDHSTTDYEQVSWFYKFLTNLEKQHRFLDLPIHSCGQTEEMNAQVVEVGGKMLEAPGPKPSFFVYFRLLKVQTD